MPVDGGDDGAGALTRGSLVDDAERVVREWLEPSRFRPGDRLPTEERLAKTLGISRGTLRSALRRLEVGGEIVRRQGSGTFVARLRPVYDSAVPPLRVESYSVLATGGRSRLIACEIERAPVHESVAKALGITPGTPALRVQRVLGSPAGEPRAVSLDIVHPAVSLPHASVLHAELDGQTMHEVLSASLEIAFSRSRTRIGALLVVPRDEHGTRLRLTAPAACLTIEQQTDIDGRTILYTWDLIVPGGVEIDVVQSAGDPLPARLL